MNTNMNTNQPLRSIAYAAMHLAFISMFNPHRDDPEVYDNVCVAVWEGIEDTLDVIA